VVGAIVLMPDDLELNLPVPLPDEWHGVNDRLAACLARHTVWPVSKWRPDAGNHRYAFRLTPAGGSDHQYWAAVLPERAGFYVLEIGGEQLTSYGPLQYDAPC
jgi:hypothetical protein